MTTPATAALVYQISTSVGLGNFTLQQVTGWRKFADSDVFGTGGTTNVFYYYIRNQILTEWEYGSGHMSDANTLVRDTVILSSNANAAVNFSPGTKDVASNVDNTASAAAASTAADIAMYALTQIQGLQVQIAAEVISAAASAATATTQAGIATTQAGNAATSASSASTSAGTATTEAGIATTQAGNASTSATNAATSATAAQGATGLLWHFDSTTAMADPGTGKVRLNNAAVGAVTAIAFSYNSDDSGNPDVDLILKQLGLSTHTPRALLIFRKPSAPGVFIAYGVSGAVVDNGTWLQIPVSYIGTAGSISNNDELILFFAISGNNGTGTGDMLAANNLSDVANVATSRHNLGLGTADTPQFTDETLALYPSSIAAAAALAVLNYIGY